MADGNIQAARTKLGRAVQRLTAPRPAVYHDRTLYAPSLYACLLDDVAGTQGDTRTPAKSLPPIWIDATQLRFDIDTQSLKWLPVQGTTPERLQLLSAKSFRPQDFDMVNTIAAKVDTWCESIINLIINPKARKYISAPCPACNQERVYRRDSGGDNVREPALKWTANVGFECAACKAHWAPDQTLFFSKLLGFELPEGVLE